MYNSPLLMNVQATASCIGAVHAMDGGRIRPFMWSREMTEGREEGQM